MTKEEIMMLANQSSGQYWMDEAHIQRFAALVASAEREACAKLAAQTVCDTHLQTGIKIYGTAVAKAIRSRGQK